MELDLLHPLTSDEDHQCDAVLILFANETAHMPSFISDEMRLSLRKRALSLIYHARLCCDFNPFLLYLSVNYVDRFLSMQQSLEKKPWIAHILSIASLSLAAKMQNTDISASLSSLHVSFMREEGFELDSQAIHRMEGIILSNLNWRLRSITPFSFVQFFVSLLKIEDSSVAQSLKDLCSDIIFNVQRDVKFLEYKPSVIAASAVLCATHGLSINSFSAKQDMILSCEHVHKDALLKCLKSMKEMSLGHAVENCTLLTPISVLDRHSTSSLSTEDGTKRRRLDYLSHDMTLCTSEFGSC